MLFILRLPVKLLRLWLEQVHSSITKLIKGVKKQSAHLERPAGYSSILPQDTCQYKQNNV